MVTRIYPYLLALYMFIYDRVGSFAGDRATFQNWLTRGRFLRHSGRWFHPQR
jgi:hypothetical protein